MDERKTPPTQAEQSAAIISRVAAIPPSRLGTASGAPSPAPGAAADVELPDFDEMREQINSVHQGPWYRVDAGSVPALSALMFCSLAVYAEGRENLGTMVLLCEDESIAVMEWDTVSPEASAQIGVAVSAHIDRQEQCNRENKRHHQGCFC
jgi:hypothetical protein